MKDNILVANVDVSGMNPFMFNAMQREGLKLTVRDIKMPFCGQKYPSLLRTFHPDVKQWRRRHENYVAKVLKSPRTFEKRSKYCNKHIIQNVKEVDFVFQISSLFAPFVGNAKPLKPYSVFSSYTTKLTERYFPPYAPFKSEREAHKWYELEKRMFQKAKIIFTLSEHTKRSMINDYGMEPQKVKIIGYGVNFEPMPVPNHNDDGKTILFVGLKWEVKNGPTLLKSFNLVRREISDARLIIVGPSFKVSNDPGVEFLGRISDRKLLGNIYSKSSIFVMPSQYEPFGLVFLEAMAHGLPCIGTNVGAMPEIISEGESGYCVPPKDEHALAQRIIELLGNRNKQLSFGKAGRERIDNYYNWSLVGKRISDGLRPFLL